MPNVNPSEALIASICTDLCFADFVAPNPKYSKGPGREREIADVLVLFDGLAIAIQVKAKVQLPSSDTAPETYAQRLNATLGKAANQLKAVKQALNAGRPIEVATSIGQQLMLDPAGTTSILGIVILDLTYEDLTDERTRIVAPYGIEHGMPVHAFTRHDFELVTKEYDTLPDLLEYLTLRERLYGAKRLFPFTREEDLVAVHKMHDPALEEVLTSEDRRLAIEPGRWDHYQSFKEEHREREEANKPSYLIDAAVSELHKGIGFSPSAEDPNVSPEDDEPGTHEAHLQIITRLARLSRVERRLVGERLLAKMQTASGKPFSFGVVMVPLTGKVVVVVSTKAERGKRRTILRNVASAALVHLNVPEVVGIATEPVESSGRSFDTCLVQADMLPEAGREEFGRLGAQLFGPLQERELTEFPKRAI
jgi:hypothetical protein